MSFLPIFLNLTDRPCLVVGGGPVAARKIRQLQKAGGKVTVVAPALCAELAAMHDGDTISHVVGNFAEHHLEGMALVIAATDSEDVNRQVSDLAKSLP